MIRAILDEFRMLCAIPHGSGFEQEIGDHLEERLKSVGCTILRDRVGNLLGDFPRYNAPEDAPLVVLQAHMDMVVAGDMAPEEAVVNAIEEDGILRSDGHTTLGADNGIGIATILSVLGKLKSDQNISHGPIRAIFTVSEEVGLKGAKEMPAEWLNGVKYMINTDGFHADTEVVGGKGGLRETFSREIKNETVKDKISFATRKKNQIDETELYQVKLLGYLGGHSGDDIDKGRCNTICQMAEILRDIQDTLDMRIVDICGGAGYNVIPSECTAIVAVPMACRISAAKILIKDETVLHKEFEKSDPTGKITVTWLGETAKGETLWDYEFQRSVLEFLTSIRDGVDELDQEGIVSSSSNLGQIFSRNGVLYIGDMIRCDFRKQEMKILEEHKNLADLTGFDVNVVGYHSWHSDSEGKLANLIADIYEKKYGEPMDRKNAKVGLEPAYFKDRAPSMEIVCLGAEISDAHSVKERVEISSIGKLYELIIESLKELAKTNF